MDVISIQVLGKKSQTTKTNRNKVEKCKIDKLMNMNQCVVYMNDEEYAKYESKR